MRAGPRWQQHKVHLVDSVSMTFKFAMALREELWLEGRKVESRLSHGEARDDGRVIVAVDRPDPELVITCEREMERLRESLPRGCQTVRLVVRASLDGVSSTLVLFDGPYSIVTSADRVETDIALLRRAASTPPTFPVVDYRDTPILWDAGSAAVLLHEAAGHPAEHGHEQIPWPDWLSVLDGRADLLAGQPPAEMYRESFADVPLRRMTEVRATQRNAPFDLPGRRIEAFLVEGGSYETVTQMVSVTVAAADLIEESGERRRMGRFEVRESRQAVARSFAGASGPSLRYPGVVCSREGQERVVASWAPLVLTSFS